jgi:hypothetical protein
MHRQASQFYTQSASNALEVGLGIGGLSALFTTEVTPSDVSVGSGCARPRLFPTRLKVLRPVSWKLRFRWRSRLAKQGGEHAGQQMVIRDANGHHQRERRPIACGTDHLY